MLLRKWLCSEAKRAESKRSWAGNRSNILRSRYVVFASLRHRDCSNKLQWRYAFAEAIRSLIVGKRSEPIAFGTGWTVSIRIRSPRDMQMLIKYRSLMCITGKNASILPVGLNTSPISRVQRFLALRCLFIEILTFNRISITTSRYHVG